MTIGGALFLTAVGAVLKWAVTGHVSWIDIQTTGTVLFVVGLVGLALATLYTFWSTRREPGDETRVMPRRPGPPRAP